MILTRLWELLIFFTIQLLSIVIEKRGGKTGRRAAHGNAQ